jgi:hypothetical protein
MKYQYGAFCAKIPREKVNYSDGVIPSNTNPKMTCNLTRASLARNATASRLSYGRTFWQNLIRRTKRSIEKKGTDSINLKKNR